MFKKANANALQRLEKPELLVKDQKKLLKAKVLDLDGVKELGLDSKLRVYMSKIIKQITQDHKSDLGSTWKNAVDIMVVYAKNSREAAMWAKKNLEATKLKVITLAKPIAEGLTIEGLRPVMIVEFGTTKTAATHGEDIEALIETYDNGNKKDFVEKVKEMGGLASYLEEAKNNDVPPKTILKTTYTYATLCPPKNAVDKSIDAEEVVNTYMDGNKKDFVRMVKDMGGLDVLMLKTKGEVSDSDMLRMAMTYAVITGC